MAHKPDTPMPVGSILRGDKSLRHALCAGAQILTCDGVKPVETLRRRDRIITRDHGAQRVRMLFSRPALAPAPMVHIPAHSFGEGKPERDILLPAHQAIALRGWRAKMIYGATEVHVAAGRVADGRIITRRVQMPGQIFSLHFNTPSVIYADGLEVLSAGAEGPDGQVRRAPGPD